MRTILSTFTRCQLPAPSCGSVSPGPAAAGRGCPAPARSRGPAQLSGDLIARKQSLVCFTTHLVPGGDGVQPVGDGEHGAAAELCPQGLLGPSVGDM